MKDSNQDTGMSCTYFTYRLSLPGSDEHRRGKTTEINNVTLHTESESTQPEGYRKFLTPYARTSQTRRVPLIQNTANTVLANTLTCGAEGGDGRRLLVVAAAPLLELLVPVQLADHFLGQARQRAICNI
jgi:hypothetical protein